MHYFVYDNGTGGPLFSIAPIVQSPYERCAAGPGSLVPDMDMFRIRKKEAKDKLNAKKEFEHNTVFSFGPKGLSIPYLFGFF
jgi:hypothetical protein